MTVRGHHVDVLMEGVIRKRGCCFYNGVDPRKQSPCGGSFFLGGGNEDAGKAKAQVKGCSDLT